MMHPRDEPLDLRSCHFQATVKSLWESSSLSRCDREFFVLSVFREKANYTVAGPSGGRGRVPYRSTCVPTRNWSLENLPDTLA